MLTSAVTSSPVFPPVLPCRHEGCSAVSLNVLHAALPDGANPDPSPLQPADACDTGARTFLAWQAANAPFIGMRRTTQHECNDRHLPIKKRARKDTCTQLQLPEKIRLLEKLKASRGIRMNSASFVGTLGLFDHTAYNRYTLGRTAIKAGFAGPDGMADIRAYQKYSFEKMVRKAGHLKPDGTIDAGAYRMAAAQRAACKAGFVMIDGSADIQGHRRHRSDAGTAIRLENVPPIAKRDPSLPKPPDNLLQAVTMPLPFIWPDTHWTIPGMAQTAAQRGAGTVAAVATHANAIEAKGESAESAWSA